ALPGVLHGCIPVARPALQLGEVVPDLRDRALNAVRHGITQELGERPAGLVQAIGELEELSHGEACTQDMGFELALHVPLQGDPAIEQLLINSASEEELDVWIRRERFGHHPWFLQLLGQLQRCASVPFRCREVSPEQPRVPEALLDPCPQRQNVRPPAPRACRPDAPGSPLNSQVSPRFCSIRPLNARSSPASPRAASNTAQAPRHPSFSATAIPSSRSTRARTGPAS